MPEFLVEVRPQRTSDQIAADRKAGTAFFARYDTENPHKRSSWNRDVDSLLRFYSYEWNLICCVIEATEWMRTHPHDTRTDRITARTLRAARYLAEEIPARDNSALQAYVHVSTIKLMHPPRVAPIPVADRLAARGEATRFWALCTNPSPRFRRRVAAPTLPFVHWLLVHPLYGPAQDGPAGYTGTTRVKKTKRYSRNSVRPIGMSEDRALEIALTATARR
ncbi:hypothetical protein RCH16_003549 [Cryobacterium sp. MP_M5]|uniref:hypothetical protein n=1 Tax=unclassified Cryobacterium TaxID=2649013 RepID=UPI0018CA2732|nr:MULTISPECIES: hypothetical protein [unclassified Cryobacterium]MBG6060092.1 hypothetical protein [Cryobacterium sp. MP_M3]MEC5178510.1 hypothetical protein [Cryobacterium sp. MP_M5]